MLFGGLWNFFDDLIYLSGKFFYQLDLCLDQISEVFIKMKENPARVVTS